MAASTCIFRRRCQMLLCIVAVCLLPGILHGHGHAHDDHDHHGHAHDEPASFKYSREANDPADAADGHSHDHGHAHDHGHGHAHDHGHTHDHGHENDHDHGHAHEHGHSHDHGHGHVHSHGHSHTKPGETKKGIEQFERGAQKASSDNGPDWMVWLKALGATAFISVSPVFILFFVPLNSADEHQDLLKVLLSFASGGLLGDAFLHLIPHAISPHSHGGEDDHGHSHSQSHSHSHDSHGHSHDHHSHDMGVGLWVLGGIVAFLMVEKFVRYVKEGSGEHAHSHSPSHTALKKEKTEEKKKSEDTKEKTEDKKDDDKKTQSPKKAKKAKDSDEEIEDDDSEDKDEEKKAEDKGDAKEKKSDSDTSGSSVKEAEHQHVSDIKVAGYLNLAADFAHNFTDGLAIGASFLGGNTLGMITTVTIFLHEIPHEIGDFAILVQSGCTKHKAMMLQFTTAIGAMLGTFCSLLVGGVGIAATAWILPFTAGGFIYIATVSVIPELLEDAKIKQSVMEIVALLVGIYMMVLIAEYE